MRINLLIRIKVYPERGPPQGGRPLRPWRRVVRLAASPEHLALILIVAWALALRLWFFVGLNWDDDVGYMGYAHQVLQGATGIPPYANFLRVGLIYPLAFFFLLFGINNVGLTLFPLICSLATHLVIYALGRRLFNLKVGLLAAFLLSFYPLDVIYATWLLPDIPISFFSGLSVLLFFLSERELKRGHLRWMAFASLAGILAAVCYLLNERGAVALLFYLAYFVYESAREWPRVPLILSRDAYLRYGLLALGFLGIFGLESFYYFVRTGDVMYRYHAAVAVFLPYSPENPPPSLNPDPSFYARAMLNLTSQYTFAWSTMYDLNYGLFFYAIVPALLACLITTERYAHAMVLWFLSIFLYLQFGSITLTMYVPFNRLPRYLAIVTIPTLLATGRWLVRPRSVVGKWVAAATVSVLCFTSLYAIAGRHRYLQGAVADQFALHTFLKDQPPRLIYADGGTVGHLLFHDGFENVELLRVLDGMEDCSVIRDAYVIVNSTRGWIEYHPFLEALPPCVKNIPPTWTLLRTIRAATLDVYARFDPEVYYAP